MTRTKLGLLGLCAVVFSLMAFNASGAQAEVGAKWLILNSKGELKESPVPLPAAIDLEIEKDGLGQPIPLVLHSEILKIKVLFLCKSVKAINANLLANGTIAKEINGLGQPVGAEVLFSGCVTHLNGVEAPECTPKDKLDGTGTIVTKKGHALLVLHKLEPSGVLDDVVRILPDEGETFATIELPAGCPIGTAVPVIGKLTLKDCENLALTHLIKHLVEPLEQLTELWTISKTTEHKATLLGSAWAFLKGEHVGLKWSGDWI